MSEVRYLVAGDSAVCVEFGNEISPEINKKIRAFKIAVEKSDIPGIVETVPKFRFSTAERWVRILKMLRSTITRPWKRSSRFIHLKNI